MIFEIIFIGGWSLLILAGLLVLADGFFDIDPGDVWDFVTYPIRHSICVLKRIMK